MKENRIRGNFLNVLDQIVNGINSSVHRSHGLQPREVNIANQSEVFDALYPNYYKNKRIKQKFLFSVGDQVRLARFKTPFSKGYRQTYTSEIFEITAIVPRYPPMYKIKSQEDDTNVYGSFYAHELSLVKSKDDKTKKKDE